MVEQVDLEATIVKTDSPVARERVHLHEHGLARGARSSSSATALSAVSIGAMVTKGSSSSGVVVVTHFSGEGVFIRRTYTRHYKQDITSALD